MAQLSSGIIQTIVTCPTPDDLPPCPVLQILGVKKLQASQGSQDRFRIVLSDGVHYYTSAMLGTQLNDIVHADGVETKAVVRLERYTCNVIQSTRKVIIILELTIVTKANDVPGKIGNPSQLSDQVSSHEQLAQQNGTAGGIQKNAPQQQNGNQFSSKPTFGGQQQQQPRGTMGGAPQVRPSPYGGGSSFYGGTNAPSRPGGGSTNHNIHPISSLTPYQNRWTIRARVTTKGPIRTWSNSRGEGKLFNVELLDESGEIRATGFNEAVDKFYELLEENKIYYISKGSLRTANKQYSSLKNDYEMYLNNDTLIELCTEKCDLPQIQYNFVNISDLESVNKDSLVDVIGVAKSSNDIVQVTTRTTNKQVAKRDVTLVDRSEKAVNLTLWGVTAEKYEEHVNQTPVLAVKGAKVSDFGGRSLSCLNSSVFTVNPDIPEAHTLRGWFDRVGKDTDLQSISGQRMEGGMAAGKFKTIAQIKTEQLGMGDKPDYFSIKATVLFMKRDNCLYQACPSAECNKKVIEDGGQWRCEKCDRSYPDFKSRMILQTNIGDFTGSQWVTCFQDSGELILSQTAENLAYMKEKDEMAFDQVFQDATFRTYIFRIRAKVETYNDERRLKCSCVNATPVDYKQESKRLLEEIRRLESI